MKYLVIISAVVSIGLILAGLYFDIKDNPLMHKMYGFGTIGLFLITFPLFLFWRRNKFSRDKLVWKNPSEREKEKTEE